ncbi:hypothetical protein SARC_03164 [Sphaeroforma arctica JP610]|uniref:Translocon-associated protein subunit delta n=1 Tax=Sphaeroforma arctica JP610 TaxID=667725 RepID=A0A0L0G6T3_9EUKA|nr:hypothetical protein SARC_03164 [Sphaeroforma arctica JP610]KNC84634.1 hypothetical protein SARC_03164 [Sphaeroforma arctica JP610]|eukprot:XP_014158536.1 hypothetical protein SARC_03164 [Sphaeroforma arctica JP610]
MFYKLCTLLLSLSMLAEGLTIVEQESYTTSEEVNSSPYAVFTMNMKLDIQSADLFAVVDNLVVPIAYEEDNYQVSWKLPYPLAHKGNHQVMIYDAASLDSVQKFQDGEGSMPQALLTAPVYFSGASKISHSVSFSLIAVCASVAGFYFAHDVKSSACE